MAERQYVKDPSAVLDWKFDWLTKGWLAAGEQITSRTVTVSPGLVKDSDSADSGSVTVWLSGGTAGDDYTVACRVTTNQGRTDERTIQIAVRDR